MTYLTAPTAGGGVSVHSPEIDPTLAQLFYKKLHDNFVYRPCTAVYTHQQIRDYQAVMITSFKKNFDHFLDEVISKGRIFFWSLTDG
jgi:hypothetical protein